MIDLNEKVIYDKKKWLDDIFSRLHKRNGFIGSVLYAESGKIVYQNAFGTGDKRLKDSLTINSSFQWASVSKMFSALFDHGRKYLRD